MSELVIGFHFRAIRTFSHVKSILLVLSNTLSVSTTVPVECAAEVFVTGCEADHNRDDLLLEHLLFLVQDNVDLVIFDLCFLKIGCMFRYAAVSDFVPPVASAIFFVDE